MIRLIVVYVVRGWLGITDGEVFLERYWQFARRRKLLYELLNELYANLNKIQEWATRHLYFISGGFYSRNRVGRLSSQIAENVLSRIDDLDVRFMDYALQNYLHSVQIINNEIAAFEANLQMEEGDTRHLPLLEAFVRGLIEHPQLKGLINDMRDVESSVCHVVSLPVSLGASQRND